MMSKPSLSEKVQFCLDWCENHEFPTKVVKDRIVFWQTNIQTAEFDCETGKLVRWWSRDYFDEIVEEPGE